MPLPTKKVVIPRQNYNRQIRTYTVLTILVLLAAGTYGYFQFQKLTEAQAALAKGQADLAALKSTETQIADQYTTLKGAFETEFKTVQNAIEGVLPSDENYTALTKALDDFVLTLNRQSPSIFMSNLKFSQPRFEKETDHAVLPMTLTLATTRANLERFLQFAENSGSLDDGTRLLDVRSISISFPQQQVVGAPAGDTSSLLNVSLAVNAYFQAPPQQK